MEQGQEFKDMSLPTDKLTDAITFKCTDEFKRKLDGCAEAVGVRSAEFIRIAVEEKVAKAESMYLALHEVFGQSKTSGSNEV
jgi:predicted DNA-binding protein